MKTKLLKQSLPVLLSILVVVDAHAIVIRHDRDETAYRELATGYSVVCQVGGGVGTLVHPRWVLTAAHVADSLPRSKLTIRIGDQVVPVARIAIHPDYAIDGKHRDLALLELAEPISDRKPARLYRSNDELGKRITFVGAGDTGTGLSGPFEGKRVMRAAHNTVTSVRPGWISFVFDAPPEGDDLEGISGPGDSGGPALLDVDGEQFVIGVSAYNSGEPPCTYGTVEHYSRVSDELEWIEGVMTGEIADAREPRMMHYSETDGGQVTVVRETPEMVEIPKEDDRRFWGAVAGLTGAIEERSTAEYLDLFSERLIQKTDRAGDPLTGILEFMIGVEEVRGPISTFHSVDDKGYDIPDSEFPMRPVTFHLKDGTSGYLGIAIDDSGKIDHFSLFVRDGLCPEGKDCMLGKPLEEVSAER